MLLFHQTFPCSALNGTAIPVLIIPGLFGSTSNWRSFAKTLSASVSTMVIDQRNHGRSPHASSQSYADMINDLIEFLDQQGIEKVYLCGHSMGGKVAMLAALNHPDRVEKLIVLDIAPVKYSDNHTPFLEALMALDLPALRSRSEADRLLQKAIPDTATRLFLLQSLAGKPDNYQWRLNLPILSRFMPQLIDFPVEEILIKSNACQTTLIYGELSSYVSAQHRVHIARYFPNVEIHSIANAGHWLHAEQPASVIDVIKNFIKSDGKEQ